MIIGIKWTENSRQWSLISNLMGQLYELKFCANRSARILTSLTTPFTPKNCRIWMTIIFVLSVLKLVEIFFSNLYRENRCESVSNSNWKTKEKIERKSIEHMKVTRTHFLFFSFLSEYKFGQTKWNGTKRKETKRTKR